jgi:hypothetical protein
VREDYVGSTVPAMLEEAEDLKAHPGVADVRFSGCVEGEQMNLTQTVAR